MNDALKKYGDIPIRLAVGFHLIYGTQDNVFSWNRMLEFRDFLQAFNFPVPLASAVLSVYAQFFCGILFILGWKVRWAGAIMTINFIVAIFMVHFSDPYPQVFPAISMLAGSLFMVMNGAGKISLVWWLKK